MSNIHELRDVIHRLHGARATYVESVSVRETHKGQIVWDGIVEVFALTGHPKANRIYAWAHDTDDPRNPRRYVTVLHIPPVISPETAVRAAIVQGQKSVTETKKTRKPGRPKLPRGESKGKFLRVRVTPDELRAFEKTAKLSGKSVSEWSRGILNAATGV